MLTENDVKEALSRSYVQAICCMGGYNYGTDAKDYGFDFTIKEILRRPSGKHCPSGLNLEIQIKATTDYKLSKTEVEYKLRNKNYNDLAMKSDATKRILVILLLPIEKAEWLKQDAEALIMKKCAYWCYLEGNGQKDNEESKTTIQIPLKNVFSVENLTKIMDTIKKGGNLNVL
mgnify:FL=1